MKKILIATRNKGKFAEFIGILKDIPFKLLFLDDVAGKGSNFPRFLENSTSEVDRSRNLGTYLISKIERFNTFEENAISKAKTYGKMSGLLTLADDSGLCVDYLNGGPGVKSHRFSRGTDKDREDKLLKVMKDVPKEKRGAKFISVVALYHPGSKKIITATGECSGEIAFEPKGSRGFGFDPLFIVKGSGKHFAELTLEEKNRVSHRAKALKEMLSLFTSEVEG